VTRGSVWYADLPQLGRKPVVVISADIVTNLLRPVVARITARERPRSLRTFVELEPDEAGLSSRSFVLCHDLVTLNRRRFDDEPVGELAVGRMVEVEQALRYALDLPG
jgi:mRNA-degrading endonuclease toxin of MazEF toxin-antitoxin module